MKGYQFSKNTILSDEGPSVEIAADSANKGRKKTKFVNAAKARSRASMTRIELIRIASIYRQKGIRLIEGDWLFVIAHVLASAPAGKHQIPTEHQRKAPFWRGLEFPFFKQTAIDCGLDPSDDELERYMNMISNWRKAANFYGPLGIDAIAKKLGVTPEIRREAGCCYIGAIGETSADRKLLRRAKDAAKKAELRRAAGCAPRSESLSQTQPWAPMGISRRTLERRRKANGLVQADANPAHSIIITNRTDDEIATSNEEAVRSPTLRQTPSAACRRVSHAGWISIENFPAFQLPESMSLSCNVCPTTYSESQYGIGQYGKGNYGRLNRPSWT